MEEENLIEKWVYTDKKLYDTLLEIQEKGGSDLEQAESIFLRVPKMYNLPVFPEDNEDDKFVSSIYEQLALLNYLEVEDNIGGNVLSSIFFIKENYLVDMELVYYKKFGSKEPPANFLGIGYKRKGIDDLPIFVMKGEDWVDLGCKYFTIKVD
ncbi:hypothetical protein ACQY1Q_17180 [Tenacibaculum sp. TC6]|uniref:hypothetical protein n=1 Tax=Tenacibaculum sp. TC6 TaxID=3423223 RepID=UPI003D35EC5A